jgi:hypothetical protein
MDDEVPAEPQQKVRSTGSNPGVCEADGCLSTKSIIWVGKHAKWYCPGHRAKASKNLDMTLSRSRPTGP